VRIVKELMEIWPNEVCDKVAAVTTCDILTLPSAIMVAQWGKTCDALKT